MKKKSSNWFEGKYVAMKDGGYLDITEAMHDSYDGKFCFQAIQYIFFVNVQLTNGELIPFPVSKLGKYTDTLSRKEEAEKLAREAVQEVKNVLLPRLEKGIEIQSIYLERKCGV